MLIENIVVYGFEPALRGMRNPRESWAKTDSYFGYSSKWDGIPCDPPWGDREIAPELPDIGPEDLKLCKKLIKAGTEHRKFLRQIVVWADLTLPRYIWTEFDTYKIGVTRNSCSTMNKLTSRFLSQSDFEQPIPEEILAKINSQISTIFSLRLASKDQENQKILRLALHQLKNILPEGFLQRATVSMNYENALNIYYQRRHHRLPEWHTICSWIELLPYMKDFLD